MRSEPSKNHQKANYYTRRQKTAISKHWKITFLKRTQNLEFSRIFLPSRSYTSILCQILYTLLIRNTETFGSIANFYFRIRKKCGKSSQMFVMKMSVSRTWCLSEKKMNKLLSFSVRMCKNVTFTTSKDTIWVRILERMKVFA